MSVRPQRRFSIARFIAPLAIVTIMGYFAFHALNGQYGIRAHISMKAQIAYLEALLAQNIETSRILEAQVGLLRPGTLERDMVDEQVRFHLNAGRADEVIFRLNP